MRPVLHPVGADEEFKELLEEDKPHKQWLSLKRQPLLYKRMELLFLERYPALSNQMMNHFNGQVQLCLNFHGCSAGKFL